MSMEVDERTVKSDSKSVAWYWVIEHFSTLKQIDACILREPAPEIHDEELGAKTREAVALRCLEEFFDPLPDPATVDARANGHFDVSRSCEEVLKYILRRALILEFKSGALESLKIRASPFIIHKRAIMGQTALTKLKDELVQGTLPFAASLSKGSRLVLANERDKDEALPRPWRSPSEANADAQVYEVQEHRMDTNLDDVNGNTDAQVPKVQESLIATTLNNVDGNADAQVPKAQESLIATTLDNMGGDADVQVSIVQEIHNADAQVSVVKESLIATSHGNMDGNGDVQVSEAQEIHNVVAEDSTVQESLIATTCDNADYIADVQVSKPQESLFYTSFKDASGNADTQVAEAEVSLIATTLDNVDRYADDKVSKAQENLICTTLDDANDNSDAQEAEAQVSLTAAILDNVDGNVDAQVSKAQESLIYTTLDDANDNADSQAAEAQVSLIPTILENMDGARGADMHAEEFFLLKRKSSDFPDKYVDGQAHEIENQGDLDGRYDHYLVSKKSRLDPSCSNQSIAQTLVPLHDNVDEFLEENISQMVGLEESRSLENGHDERLGLVSEINGNSNLQPNQSEIAYNNEKVSRGASGNGNHDYLSVGVVNDVDLRASSVALALKTHNFDEGKIHTDDNLHENEPANTMEHLSKEDNEFDNDGYDNERLKDSEKERNILNSPRKVNHGSSKVSELPVLNPCVKCNKEGSLLFCSSSNCFLGIHESCLGSPVKFDDQGNFYCPFCAYTHALSEYHKCTESVYSAKKEFHSFFNKNDSHRPKEHAKKL